MNAVFRNHISRVLFLIATGPSLTLAVDIDGFTEPYQSIDVAASEMGTLDAIMVEEGDQVRTDQIMANLDEDVLLASLEIAKTAWTSEGRLKSALADVHMQQQRLTKLQGLRERHHASQVEVDRTANQLEVAEAQLLSVREDLRIKKLECERIKAQLEQRRIRAPIDGIVTNVYKHPGEFVASTDPVVVQVVQLDPLLVIFSVPDEASANLRTGDSVPVEFENLNQTVEGFVEYVSPTKDAQSGTIRVKVRLSNPNLALPSGEACKLCLTGASKLDSDSRPSTPLAIK